MGEYADYEINDMIWRDFFEEFSRPTEFRWLDKDGNSWRLCDMKESHINNCINLLKNKLITTELKMSLLNDELNRRKEEKESEIIF